MIARADQLDLEVAPIGQREVEHRIGRLAAVLHPFEVDAFDDEEWADAHHLRPMLHRRVEILRHESELHDVAQTGN